MAVKFDTKVAVDPSFTALLDQTQGNSFNFLIYIIFLFLFSFFFDIKSFVIQLWIYFSIYFINLRINGASFITNKRKGCNGWIWACFIDKFFVAFHVQYVLPARIGMSLIASYVGWLRKGSHVSSDKIYA